jgi:hypothetical protein
LHRVTSTEGYTSETEEWAHLYGTAANGSSSSSSSSDGHSSDGGNSSGAEAPVSAGTGGAAAMDVDGPLPQPLGQPLDSSTAAAGRSDAHTRFTPAAAAWTRAEHCTVTYCVLCRSGGTLEVYRLQRAADVSADASADASSDVIWSLVFVAAGASGAPSTLWNDAATAAAATGAAAAAAGGSSGGGAGDQHSAEAEAHSMDVVDTADGYGSAHGLQQPLDGPLDAGGASPGTKKSKKRKSKTGGDSSTSTADSAAAAAAAVAYDTVADVLLQPVGAVKAPAALQRLALVLRLSSGDLLVYEVHYANIHSQ